MKRTIFYVICWFCIVSCAATSQNYAQKLQPWIGQPETRLLQAWGNPHNVFQVSPNEKVITFLRIASNGHKDAYGNQIYYPAFSSSNFWIPGPDDQQNNTYYCKTSFTIRNGVVVNYNYNGDYCVAR